MVFCQKKYVYVHIFIVYLHHVGCIDGWVRRASFVVAGRGECRATPSQQACQVMAVGQEEHASDRHCVYTRVSFISCSVQRSSITYLLLFIAVNLNCNVRGCQAVYRLNTHFASSPALSMCTHSHSEQVSARSHSQCVGTHLQSEREHVGAPIMCSLPQALSRAGSIFGLSIGALIVFTLSSDFSCSLSRVSSLSLSQYVSDRIQNKRK